MLFRSPQSNDHELLSEIYEKLKLKDDIYLLHGNLNAAQTKWIISKLACLIASRTHATIAAFSSCVPTVSLAYSVKAYGLNEKLFGCADFVVAPNGFSIANVFEKVEMVLRQNLQIREHLKASMLDIRNHAINAGVELKKLIEN